MARAAIVVGLPFQNIKEPKVKLKIEYMNEKFKEVKERRVKLLKQYNSELDDNLIPNNHLDGNGWYTLEMMRTVNQSIGRVIRHSNDYGAILFIDERFLFISCIFLYPIFRYLFFVHSFFFPFFFLF
jgi:regulator of telomere elongation helicase 1